MSLKQSAAILFVPMEADDPVTLMPGYMCPGQAPHSAALPIECESLLHAVFLLTFNFEIIINSHKLAKTRYKGVPAKKNVQRGFPIIIVQYQNEEIGISLVVQWLRIHLPMQGAQV